MTRIAITYENSLPCDQADAEPFVSNASTLARRPALETTPLIPAPQPLPRRSMRRPGFVGGVFHSRYARDSYLDLGIPSAVRTFHNGFDPRRFEPRLSREFDNIDRVGALEEHYDEVLTKRKAIPRVA